MVKLKDIPVEPRSRRKSKSVRAVRRKVKPTVSAKSDQLGGLTHPSALDVEVRDSWFVSVPIGAEEVKAVETYLKDAINQTLNPIITKAAPR
ncbi:UNVERIFIED_ORG: hypothetical protein GGD43_004479 [Rhizobium esperanzae]